MSTKIAWTDQTWNPIVGCSPVSEGCRNCYAARFASRGLRPEHRGLTRNGRWTGEVRCLPERLDQPLRWRKPRRVFVCSMSDLFHENVPNDFIDRVFAVMALSRQHTFQILTKRTERMRTYSDKRLHYPGGMWDAHIQAGSFAPSLGDLPNWPLPNVWLGYSASTQKDLDAGVGHLLQTPAAVRFVSCEPLLGPIDLDQAEVLGLRKDEKGWTDWGADPALDWVIVGGESWPGARPCDVQWIRSIVEQCKAAGIPVFVKQLGAHPYEQHGEMDFCCDKYNEHPGKHPIGRLDPDGITRPFRSRSAADPAEWPADLRVREYPKEKPCDP